MLKRKQTILVSKGLMNFDGFVLLGANNSLHKTHCCWHKPCLSLLQVNLYLMNL